MRWAAKDSAGAVVHQDKIRDVNRNFPLGVKGMLGCQAGVKTSLLGFFNGLFRGPKTSAVGNEGGQHLIRFGHLCGQRVIG